FFFFLNVTRVLLLKLRSSVNPESMKYRKLGKSTLVLVPLFGVHYFLLWGLSTSSNVGVELAWLFLDQVFCFLSAVEEPLFIQFRTEEGIYRPLPPKWGESPMTDQYPHRPVFEICLFVNALSTPGNRLLKFR
ncbi:Corticotropin-releasing factor receptor 1, partial [Armadillidium vulgare]